MKSSTPQRGRTSKAAFDLPGKAPAEMRHAKRIFNALLKYYPDAHCELDYSSPHELLIATILSAQATDVSVNKVTPALFRAFPSPSAFTKVTPEQIEPFIRTIGLYRNKAKAVHAAMMSVVKDFGGEVPRTMEELLTLRGVARKTANVVLGNAYEINVGFVVDTHVLRLAGRFDLSHEKDARKVERDLMALFPRPHWTKVGHMLIWHGRRVCKARGALCREHPICGKFCSNARGRA